MIDVRRTVVFREWFNGLRDLRAKMRIDAQIRKLSLGNFGDVKPVGEGVSEIRIHYGPGYRIYFVQHGREVVVLLCGGDKSGQKRDIEDAVRISKELKNGHRD